MRKLSQVNQCYSPNCFKQLARVRKAVLSTTEPTTCRSLAERRKQANVERSASEHQSPQPVCCHRNVSIGSSFVDSSSSSSSLRRVHRSLLRFPFAYWCDVWSGWRLSKRERSQPLQYFLARSATTTKQRQTPRPKPENKNIVTKVSSNGFN